MVQVMRKHGVLATSSSSSGRNLVSQETQTELTGEMIVPEKRNKISDKLGCGKGVGQGTGSGSSGASAQEPPVSSEMHPDEILELQAIVQAEEEGDAPEEGTAQDSRCGRGPGRRKQLRPQRCRLLQWCYGGFIVLWQGGSLQPGEGPTKVASLEESEQAMSWVTEDRLDEVDGKETLPSQVVETKPNLGGLVYWWKRLREGKIGGGMLGRSSLLNKKSCPRIKKPFLKDSKERGLVIYGSGLRRSSCHECQAFRAVFERGLTSIILRGYV